MQHVKRQVEKEKLLRPLPLTLPTTKVWTRYYMVKGRKTVCCRNLRKGRKRSEEGNALSEIGRFGREMEVLYHKEKRGCAKKKKKGLLPSGPSGKGITAQSEKGGRDRR